MCEDTSVVLVVEDEADLADFFATVLQQEYEVRVALDGTEAVEAYDESVDVALLDRRMPKRRGSKVLTHIRDAPGDCAVAMVTAVGPDFDIIEMGFDDYVRKPVSRDELVSLVERMVRRRQFDDSLRSHYRLARTAALLETQKSSAELAESDEYDRLLAELEATEQELVGSAELSAADVGSLIRDDGSPE
ncbi:MAG: HoxA-like transcriptional regulator [uncultured archaeon A07HB70]|nr:MAG: HoxA-like transcriptional regulator [uncultured archaeon A07HB70]